MRRAFPLLASALAGVIAVSGAAFAQAVAPQQAPGQPATTAAAQPVETRIVKAEVERKGRGGADIYLGAYLTLSKDCKVGANPRLEVPEQPKGGKVVTRPNALNLRQVPGAPRNNCIGTSPYALGVFYRPERRFKGEDTFLFKIVYPTGEIREVTAKVTVQ